MVPAGPGKDPGELTAAEQAALARMDEHRKWGTGYSTQQSTRPQTLGYGLVDSPAAQAAWIVEKFWAWADHDGHPEDAFPRERLLDNVMHYWLPGAGASSARLYWESFNASAAADDRRAGGDVVLPGRDLHARRAAGPSVASPTSATGRARRRRPLRRLRAAARSSTRSAVFRTVR